MQQVRTRGQKDSNQSFRLSPALLVSALVIAMAVAAFAVPKILDSRVVAGETTAIGALINISEAQDVYRNRFPLVGYAPNLQSMQLRWDRRCNPTPDEACILDYRIAHAGEQEFGGYRIVEVPGSEQPRASYTLAATPARYARTGSRAFCLVEGGMPRYRDFGRDVRPQEITREQCLNEFSPLP